MEQSHLSDFASEFALRVTTDRLFVKIGMAGDLFDLLLAFLFRFLKKRIRPAGLPNPGISEGNEGFKVLMVN